jgi:hypothetical protein
MATKVLLGGRLMFPSEYVAAAEFQGRDVTLTIAAIRLEDLQIRGGKKERKPILTFRETKKKLVLNKTNAGSIADMHGPKAELWIGKKVTLYPTRTQCGRETVDCIRVREGKNGSVNGNGSHQFDEPEEPVHEEEVNDAFSAQRPAEDGSSEPGDPSSPDSAMAPTVDATDETVDAGVSEAHEESAQQPEAPGADAPQAPTSAELATWDKFRTWACNHYAKHHRIEHVDAATALAKWAAQNLIAKDPKKGLEARTALSVLILENGLDLATGEIKEA